MKTKRTEGIPDAPSASSARRGVTSKLDAAEEKPRRLLPALRRQRRALVALALSGAALLLAHEIQVREGSAPEPTRSWRDPGPSVALAPRETLRIRPVFTPQEGGPPVETILGRVVGADGAPVARATAEVEGSTVLTGTDGRFRLPRASGRVRISHRDHFPRDVDAASFPSRLERPGDEGAAGAASPVELPALDIVLAPGARVHGAVLGAEGSPIRGARVHFGAADAPAGVLTDEHGAYESPLLTPGPIPIFVSHPDHQPHSGTAALGPGALRARFDVRLQGGAKLAVRVSSLQREPVPDAEVWIQLGRLESGSGAGGTPVGATALSPGASAPRAMEEWRFLGRTGDLGALDTRREPGREARIRVLAAGFREEVRRVEGTEVSFALSPAPAIRGHAVHATTGLPIPLKGVRLEVLAPAGFQEAPDRGRLFQSLSAGKFVVGLPPYPGVYRVSVTGEEGLRGTTEGLRFDGKEPPGPAIARLEERLDIHGSVRGPEGLVDRARVELVHEEASGRRLQRLLGAIVPAPHRLALESLTGPEGRFEFGDVPAGTYRFRVRKEGLAEHLSSPFSLPWQGEYLVLLRRAASLRGTLLGGKGEPEPNVPMLLTRDDEPARVATTDTAGRFTFESLPPGTDYRLRIGDPSHAHPEPADLEEVPIGAPASDGPSWALTIEEGAQVTFDPSREPSPAAIARDTIAAEGARTPGEPIVSPPDAGAGPADGEIAFADAKEELLSGELTPGTFDLAEDVSGPVKTGASAEERTHAEPAVATHRVRFDLVQALASKPFRGACEVELIRREAAGTRARTTRSGVTPIEFEGLQAGTYEARVRARGLLHWEGEIVVSGDLAETVPIDQGEDITLQVLVSDGVEFRGRAEVVLWKAGREVYRVFEEIGGSVTVPTAGPGDYELLVHSENRRAQVTFTLTREEVENEDPGGDN